MFIYYSIPLISRRIDIKMWFQCSNPEHRCRIVWNAKQPVLKTQSGLLKIIPQCPNCRNNEYVEKFKRVVK